MTVSKTHYLHDTVNNAKQVCKDESLKKVCAYVLCEVKNINQFQLVITLALVTLCCHESPVRRVEKCEDNKHCINISVNT